MGLEDVGILSGCRGCGVVYRTDRPGAPLETYDAEYFSSYEVFLPGSALNRARQKEFHRRLALLESRAPGRVLLDVGCGNGDFLALARARGWCGYGVDITEYAKRRLETFGVPLHVGDAVAYLKSRPGMFDVVHMNHTLEHMPDPRAAVLAAFEGLKAGGHLYIEVPNEFRNLLYRIAEGLGRKRKRGSLFGRSTPLPGPSPHRFFFDAGSLALLVRSAGFASVSVHARARSDFLVRNVAGVLCRIGMLLNRGLFLTLLAVKDGNGFREGPG
jgi:SAM-dependent methyltransferase